MQTTPPSSPADATSATRRRAAAPSDAPPGHGLRRTAGRCLGDHAGGTSLAASSAKALPSVVRAAEADEQTPRTDAEESSSDGELRARASALGRAERLGHAFRRHRAAGAERVEPRLGHSTSPPPAVCHRHAPSAPDGRARAGRSRGSECGRRTPSISWYDSSPFPSSAIRSPGRLVGPLLRSPLAVTRGRLPTAGGPAQAARDVPHDGPRANRREGVDRHVHVGQPAGDLAHQRTLVAVPLAAATEDQRQLSRGDLTRGAETALEGVGRCAT